MTTISPNGGPAATAAARYRFALPPGEMVEFPITALDRTGVPAWSLTLYQRGGGMPGGHGYGTTDDEARVGALGELSEVAHAAIGLRRLERRSGSYRELVFAHGRAAVLDPLTLCLPAGSPVDHDTHLTWLAGQRWRTNERVWVPLDVAASLVGDLDSYQPFTTPITNGLGAGPSVHHALAHALCELVQRDGNGLEFRALDQGRVLDLDGAAPAVRALVDQLEGVGVEVIPKLASTEFGLANVYVVGADAPDGPDGANGTGGSALMATACGEAADPDRDRALAKALLEFAAARVRKAFTHGPLEPVVAIAPPDYLDTYTAHHRFDGEEERALQAMVAWLGMSGDELRAALAGSVLSRRSVVPLSSLPSAPGAADAEARCEAVVSALERADLDVVWLDLSPRHADELGVHVVKAIVPGMEVETMSYHRIGERGVRKLVARDDPLAGLGPAPHEGCRPVRLTAAATERLGGPAWLDVERIDRLVGALYPLYREPGRHSAPLLAGARP